MEGSDSMHDLTAADSTAIETAYILELEAAMLRYRDRMTGRLPVPEVTPAEAERAERVRSLAQITEAVEAAQGLDAGPTLASVERFLRTA